VESISDIERCILSAIYQSEFAEWDPVTMSPLTCRSTYISAMWMRHSDLPTKSIIFNRCSSTMIGALVRTIWKGQWHLLPFEASTILTLWKVSTYYELPWNGGIWVEPISYPFPIVSKSYFPAPYHNRYIIWEKLMSAVCAEVSN
jgi:hypothetical protein